MVGKETIVVVSKVLMKILRINSVNLAMKIVRVVIKMLVYNVNTDKLPLVRIVLA